MKAVVYHGGTDVRYEELPVPTLEADEALIKVGYAGVCGSDITIYTGKHKRVKPPVVFGHEVSGELVALGSPAPGLQVGDRVVAEPLVPCGECYACQSGSYNVCKTLHHLGIDIDGMFAEYVKAQIKRVYRAPEGVSLQGASLVEPTSVAVHAVQQARLKLGDRVVVLGGGPIGLLTAQVARTVTSMPVELVEVSDWRLDLARRLGFEPIDAKKGDVLSILLDRTDGKGADVLFETAGVPATTQLLPQATRIRGLVVMVAMPKEPQVVDLTAFDLKEIGMVGSRAYMRPDIETAIHLISQGKIDVESMVSHVMPLEDWKEALELAKKGDASMKIVLQP